MIRFDQIGPVFAPTLRDELKITAVNALATAVAEAGKPSSQAGELLKAAILELPTGVEFERLNKHAQRMVRLWAGEQTRGAVDTPTSDLGRFVALVEHHARHQDRHHQLDRHLQVVGWRQPQALFLLASQTAMQLTLADDQQREISAAAASIRELPAAFDNAEQTACIYAYHRAMSEQLSGPGAAS